MKSTARRDMLQQNEVEVQRMWEKEAMFLHLMEQRRSSSALFQFHIPMAACISAMAFH